MRRGPLAFTTLAACALAAVLGTAGAATAPPELGSPAPAALGVKRDGTPVEAGQFAGKVLVVSFFASWCGPCKAELPVLEGIQRTYKERLQVVVVNIEERDEFRRNAKALDSLALAFTHDYNKLARDSYGVGGIPHMVIVGRDGRIVRRHVGYGEGSLQPIVDEINSELSRP
jgi:thiol-disulfide isomerase/thioredoxin